MKDGYTIKGNQTWHVAVSAKAPGARRGPRTRSRFPAGRTDDIADAMGLLGRLMDKMFGASIPKPDEEQHTDGGYGYRPVADLEADILGYDHDDEKSWRVM